MVNNFCRLSLSTGDYSYLVIKSPIDRSGYYIHRSVYYKNVRSYLGRSKGEVYFVAINMRRSWSMIAYLGPMPGGTWDLVLGSWMIITTGEGRGWNLVLGSLMIITTGERRGGNLVLVSLMMLTGAPNSGVTGGRTMLLAGAILGQGIRNVVDTSATHNVIDVGISYVYWITPQAHRIYCCSTSPRSIPRYRYLFYSKGKR